MAHINLLPWREELKKEREIRFFMFTAIGLVISGLIFLAVYLYIDMLITHQQTRNAYLEKAIKEANDAIEVIKGLEAEKADVEKRIKVIEKLQLSRPEAVYMFNEVCKIPDGVYYRTIEQKGYKIALSGEAQSPARVSTLMDNLDASPWLRNPDLSLVQEINEDEKNRAFELTIQQISPEEIEEAEKNQANK